jgi:hypothetical protein
MSDEKNEKLLKARKMLLGAVDYLKKDVAERWFLKTPTSKAINVVACSIVDRMIRDQNDPILSATVAEALENLKQSDRASYTLLCSVGEAVNARYSEFRFGNPFPSLQPQPVALKPEPTRLPQKKRNKYEFDEGYNDGSAFNGGSAFMPPADPHMPAVCANQGAFQPAASQEAPAYSPSFLSGQDISRENMTRKELGLEKLGNG